MELLILQLLQTRRGRIIAAVMSLLAATFFGVFAWPNVSDAIELARHHERILANVAEHRTTTGMYLFDGSYDIRYTFKIAGRGLYEQREKGPLARRELWSSLRKPDWLDAIRTGVVPVMYSKNDPSINALEQDVKSNVYSLYAFCLISAMGVIASLIWLIRLVFFWRPQSSNTVQWYIRRPGYKKLSPATPKESKDFFKQAEAKTKSFRMK